MTIQTSGFDQVMKALSQAPSLLVMKGFQQALDLAGGVIQAEMEARLEADTALRESVRNAYAEHEGILTENAVVSVSVDSSGRGGVAKIGFRSTPSDRTGEPADLIALWVERGHVMLSHDKSPTKLEHVPAYPFMRPAAEASASRAIEVFRATIESIIDSGTIFASNANVAVFTSNVVASATVSEYLEGVYE